MKTCKECNNCYKETILNNEICKTCEVYNKYDDEWFYKKLNEYIYKTGFRTEDLLWIISEDLKPILLEKQHKHRGWCVEGLMAKDIDWIYHVENIPEDEEIDYQRIIAIIYDIKIVYTDELKNTAILIKVR